MLLQYSVLYGTILSHHVHRNWIGKSEKERHDYKLELKISKCILMSIRTDIDLTFRFWLWFLNFWFRIMNSDFQFLMQILNFTFWFWIFKFKKVWAPDAWYQSSAGNFVCCNRNAIFCACKISKSFADDPSKILIGIVDVTSRDY